MPHQLVDGVYIPQNAMILYYTTITKQCFIVANSYQLGFRIWSIHSRSGIPGLSLASTDHLAHDWTWAGHGVRFFNLGPFFAMVLLLKPR